MFLYYCYTILYYIYCICIKLFILLLHTQKKLPNKSQKQYKNVLKQSNRRSFRQPITITTAHAITAINKFPLRRTIKLNENR